MVFPFLGVRVLLSVSVHVGHEIVVAQTSVEFESIGYRGEQVVVVALVWTLALSSLVISRLLNRFAILTMVLWVIFPRIKCLGGHCSVRILVHLGSILSLTMALVALSSCPSPRCSRRRC